MRYYLYIFPIYFILSISRVFIYSMEQKLSKPKPNAWVMKPDSDGKKVYAKFIDSKDWLKDYYPDGYELMTTQHKTGINDYYCLFYDSREGKPFNESSLWLLKHLPVNRNHKILGNNFHGWELKPTGNFVIVHYAWKDIDGESVEQKVPITISFEEMIEFFK